MNIREFVEKAIEGGWTNFRTFEDNPQLDGSFRGYCGLSIYKSDVDTIFLDPLAWRAVGKVEGWSVRVIEECGEVIEDEQSSVCLWEIKQLNFVKHLQKGLSIEEALNNI